LISPEAGPDPGGGEGFLEVGEGMHGGLLDKRMWMRRRASGDTLRTTCALCRSV
jgi:hypothetical protein